MAQSPPSPQPDEPKTPEPDRLAEAYRVIAEHEQQRIQACAAEIQQVLAKYGMRLDVTPARIVLTPQPGTEVPP